MENFISKEDLLVEIGGIFAKMENGTISLSEMNELVELTSELNQRSIILRYKAIEKEVLGTSEQIIEETVETPIQDEIEEEEIVSEIEEVNTIEVSEEEEEIAAPSFESVKVEEEPISFGFNLFDFEEKNEEQSSNEMEENIASEETVSEKVEDKIEEEPIIDQPTYFETPSYVETIVVEQHSPIEQHTIIEEENDIGEPSAFSYSELATFINKFNQVEAITSTQFGLVKIDSLIGSFGLNERLQYINELFDGSSENFSDAIKVLDNQSTIDSARTKTAELALINNWDIESDTIVEFMQKVVRRYA